MQFRVIFAAVAFISSVQPTAAQSSHVIETSKYWCGVLQGTYDGRNCKAIYKKWPKGDACKVFDSVAAGDAGLTRTVIEVRNAQLCLAKVVDDAKSNSLKQRVRLRGYVTAGQNEEVNDPISPSFQMPLKGKPSFPSAAAFFMYECVVEVCLSK